MAPKGTKKATKGQGKIAEEKKPTGSESPGETPDFPHIHDLPQSMEIMDRVTLETIHKMMREEINAAIDDKLQPQLSKISTELKECVNKVTNAEQALSEIEDRITMLEASNQHLIKENKELKEKAEKLEFHSRKYNLRVFGLNREVEKGDPTAYMTNFFKSAFTGERKLPVEPGVEIAHRIGQVPKSGGRAMMVRMQRYAAKEAILKRAKENGVIEFEGMKVRIFPDLTADLAKRRAQFQGVRAKLSERGIRHGIIHPAMLIVSFKDEKKYFKNSADAESFFKTMIDK